MSGIDSLVLDCVDVREMARFWSEALQAPVIHDWTKYIVIGTIPPLGLQEHPNPTPGKNRMHLHLGTHDLVAEVTRLVDLGAVELATVEMTGSRWAILGDPEGNEFCVLDVYDADLLEQPGTFIP